MFWNAAKELIGFVIVAAFALFALLIVGGFLSGFFGA